MYFTTILSAAGRRPEVGFLITLIFQASVQNWAGGKPLIEMSNEMSHPPHRVSHSHASRHSEQVIRKRVRPKTKKHCKRKKCRLVPIYSGLVH